jgi:2-succinyl-6-hydroxy-2,4-cyclohexadiene-1-carboxylate synthase
MQLSYEYSGDRSGTPVIFLHGFMGCGDEWNEIVERLPELFCILPDLPGHGRSVDDLAVDDCSFKSTARSLIDLMDRLELDTACLIGYSMGGRIALYTAIEYQQRFFGLVLESASPGLESDAARRDRRAQDEKTIAQMQTEGIDKFVDRWLSNPMFAAMRDRGEAFDRLKTLRCSNSIDSLALSLRCAGTGMQPSLWGRLHELKLPVMLVCGDGDGKYISIAERMSREIDDCAVARIPYSGHNTHFERPDQFRESILQFVNKNVCAKVEQGDTGNVEH